MNIPSTGNSGEKNQKRPRLYLLATATLLLSAISFIGVGAIPQAQALCFEDEVCVEDRAAAREALASEREALASEREAAVYGPTP
jgi:hypothetical protein